MTTESETSSDDKLLLAHHVQQKLCTTRLPYRQGRKLTAVKVYTINNESNHLLIFGVPSLNLRQEAKNHFLKFGKLKQFAISQNHAAEQFTETYHAVYEKIHSARMAKRMLDTKTFYGGSLHICYAPEFETLDETKAKLLQRKADVLHRLKNLEKQAETYKKSTEMQNEDISEVSNEKVYYGPKLPNEHNTLSINSTEKLNMGNINTICIGKQIRDVVMKKKRKNNDKDVKEKKFKPSTSNEIKNSSSDKVLIESSSSEKNIEIIDCTSIERDTVTNIDEALNYKKFGNETIVNITNKPVNKIKFNLPNIKL